MTAQELEKLLADVTPGEWKTRTTYFEEDGFVEIVPRKVRGKSHPEAGQWGELATVDSEYTDSKPGANARLIALAPTLARRVIAAEKLVEALTACMASIEHADMSDGVCCCGDDMDNHAEPMSCGHIPTDAGDYDAMLVIQRARAALAAWEAAQ